MGIFNRKPKRPGEDSRKKADEDRAKFFNNISGQSWNKAKTIKIKKPGGIQAARMRRRKHI